MIETERLVLRPFRESDAADVLEYLRKPAVNCFACMKLDSLKAARGEIKRRAKDEMYLAIVLKESGKAIGEHSSSVWMTMVNAYFKGARYPLLQENRMDAESIISKWGH